MITIKRSQVGKIFITKHSSLKIIKVTCESPMTPLLGKG